MQPPIPQVTSESYETTYRHLHLIHHAVDHWAELKGDQPAIVNATHGTKLTWRELQLGSMSIASELRKRGLKKGDFVAASLPLLNEHILLEYACFRLGLIHVPLDLRLQPPEVVRSVQAVKARAFVGVQEPVVEVVKQQCPSVEMVLPVRGLTAGTPEPLSDGPEETDGAQVIFTTGSTGSPKPALLTHRGITCQNLCLGAGLNFTAADKVLCNLPASHVGGQAELLLTTLFTGGTAVTLEIFDPVKSLDAMERYGVTLVGQIPAMFNMEWRTADYQDRDLSSIQAAVYGGQSVPRSFLQAMLKMAPVIGTGLGLTEASGFCTYTRLTADADEVARGIGWAMPVYPLAIRRDMRSDGLAGDEVAPGDVGHVCLQGPQTFAGYVNDPEATARTISRDGWLYTGDMGSYDEAGLHFSGRAKWVIKPRGYQVFAGDVENHFAALADKVAAVGVVGHEHGLWSEAIVAFVEKKAGIDLTEPELRKHARGLASYMRPSHYVVVESGTLPLNRTAKLDTLKLQEMARGEVQRLRERGRWDRGAYQEE